MKKILALTLAALCLLSLVACGEAGNNTKTSSTIATTVIPKPENSFYLAFSNQDLIPGAVFPAGWLPEADFEQETPDCVNGGQTKLYFYEYLQVTTYMSGEQEILYSIIMNPDKGANTPTAEGLYFGDDAARVEELYGTGAEKDGDVWTYRKGNTLLILQFGNDQVVGIEYQQA